MVPLEVHGCCKELSWSRHASVISSRVLVMAFLLVATLALAPSSGRSPPRLLRSAILTREPTRVNIGSPTRRAILGSLSTVNVAVAMPSQARHEHSTSTIATCALCLRARLHSKLCRKARRWHTHAPGQRCNWAADFADFFPLMAIKFRVTIIISHFKQSVTTIRVLSPQSG